MKKQFIIVLMVSLFTPIMGQKQMEMPTNDVVTLFVERLPGELKRFRLEDLRSSTDSLVIRIWKRNEIVTIKANRTIDYQYTLTTNDNRSKPQEITYTGKFPLSYLDSLNRYHFSKLANDDHRGVDGSFVFFEIATKTSYKICSFWSPDGTRDANEKIAVQTIALTNRLLNASSRRDSFIENLAPGSYTWGMGMLRIDRFPGKEVKKTDFYKTAEKRIRAELSITNRTSHLLYPLILINEKPVQLADLNNYSQKEIDHFEILKPDNKIVAIYGTSGSAGVVKVKTK